MKQVAYSLPWPVQRRGFFPSYLPELPTITAPPQLHSKNRRCVVDAPSGGGCLVKDLPDLWASGVCAWVRVLGKEPELSMLTATVIVWQPDV